MSDLVANLSAKLDALVGPLLAGSPGQICVVDPPLSFNIGDHLIFLGMLSLFKKHAPNAKILVTDYRDFRPENAHCFNSVDLFAFIGGGAFGDTWPKHHNFRLQMMERFASVPAIQFPQSIHFQGSESSLERTREVINQHKSLTLLFRDVPSVTFAKPAFDVPVHLSPDCAFAMGTLERSRPDQDFACLLRTDKEKVASHNVVLECLQHSRSRYLVSDWLDAPARMPWIWPDPTNPAIRWCNRFRNHVNVLRPIMNALLVDGRKTMAERLREKGIHQLGRGSYVVTDRLHAHIMCVLLGIPHLVIDSFGGKISAYHSTWTHEDPGARLVENAEAFPAAFDAFQADYPLS